ncbi:putative holin-like toxin [Geobacillus kaustophilus]
MKGGCWMMTVAETLSRMISFASLIAAVIVVSKEK